MGRVERDRRAAAQDEGIARFRRLLRMRRAGRQHERQQSRRDRGCHAVFGAPSPRRHFMATDCDSSMPGLGRPRRVPHSGGLLCRPPPYPPPARGKDGDMRAWSERAGLPPSPCKGEGWGGRTRSVRQLLPAGRLDAGLALALLARRERRRRRALPSSCPCSASVSSFPCCFASDPWP